MSGFIESMQERGLVAQIIHPEEFSEHCRQATRAAYIGFDPTADSLHVGHLTQLMMLSRWQSFGHRVIVVMGGGTALVGDPTGKTEMRSMLSEEQIHANIESFKRQVQGILDLSDPSKGIIVNNADWLRSLNYLDFLRKIGQHFSVNRMLTAECFRARMEKGLSFIEFNYMLLQAYDFLHLFASEGCTVQMGGDDQWSNILAGVELIHRVQRKQSYCMTIPLLTTSDGKKMGKTEKGAVWIDRQKTSPYEYFQFWRNVQDDMVGICLRSFTHLSIEEIRELERLQGAEINQAKERLAYECTQLVHGRQDADLALQSAKKLFSGPGAAGDLGGEPEFFVEATTLTEPQPLIDVLVQAGIFATKAEVRRLIQQGGLVLADKKVHDSKALIHKPELEGPEGLLVRKGKKHYYRLRIR